MFSFFALLIRTEFVLVFFFILLTGTEFLLGSVLVCTSYKNCEYLVVLLSALLTGTVLCVCIVVFVAWGR